MTFHGRPILAINWNSLSPITITNEINSLCPIQVRGAFITRDAEPSNVDAIQATISRFGLFSQASLQVCFNRNNFG